VPVSNKSDTAKNLGLPDPTGNHDIAAPTEIGKAIQVRAAYGRVDVKSITKYLESLALIGVKVKSAYTANLSMSSIQSLRKMDPEFVEEEERALQMYIADVIDEPIRRFGLEGVHRMAVDKNGEVHELELQIQPQLALAYARKFDKAYRDKQEIDVNHSGGVVIVKAEVPALDLEAYARKMEADKRAEMIDTTATPLPDKSNQGTVSKT